MAGTNYNATNVTLYNAGGSGDNMISDGYIRAVEKIWLDSYVWTASAGLLGTSDTVCIGVIPANKKIVGCEVFYPATYAPATALINVSTAAGTSGTLATLLISAGAISITAPTMGTVVYGKLTMNNQATMGFVTTQSTLSVSGGAAVILANTYIYLSVLTTALTAPTAGTITTIIRYT